MTTKAEDFISYRDSCCSKLTHPLFILMYIVLWNRWGCVANSEFEIVSCYRKINVFFGKSSDFVSTQICNASPHTHHSCFTTNICYVRPRITRKTISYLEGATIRKCARLDVTCNWISKNKNYKTSSKSTSSATATSASASFKRVILPFLSGSGI